MKMRLAALIAAGAWSIAAEGDTCTAESEALHIFAFGSSWSDTTFNVSGTQPSIAAPLGNPEFESTGNEQGGPNFLSYLTETYNSSTTLLYNLAVSGASIDNNIVEGFDGVTDMLHQVNESFANNYATQYGSLWNSENTIFNIWMGDNDVYKGYNSSLDYDTLVSELMYQYWDVAVAQLYDLGARNFFIVGVPAQERSPRVAKGGSKSDATKYNELKWKYDEALFARTQAFQAQHVGDVKTAFFNSSAWMNTVLDNPTVYGFNETTYCSPPEYPMYNCIWNNNFHLVSEAHALMAEAMVTPMQTLGY